MSTQVTSGIMLIDKERLGYQAISLDSLTTTAAVTIKAGSKVEIGGALYDFTVDELESGGTWAGIGNSNVVYIYVVPAGGTATWIYSTTAPAWDTAKQGWYNAATGGRCVASLYKDSGGNYTQKCIFPPWSQGNASGLPAGIIEAFGGESIPGGWLLCDGTSYLRAMYPNLFAAIGTAYGTADGTHFNVPDLRGQFIRGRDRAAGIDPDRAARTAPKAGGNTGDAVGSAQPTATKLPNTAFTTGNDSPAHTHNVPYTAVSETGSGTNVAMVPTGAQILATGNPSVSHTHPINGGDNESRPLNVYVNYIIKA